MFYPPKRGPFLSLPCPFAFVAQNVLSAPHITGEPPKNCAPARCKNTYIPCWTPFNPPRQRKKNAKKGGGGENDEKRKTWPRCEIPRNVSTFLAGEKATPAVRLSFYSLHKARIYVYTHARARSHARTRTETSKQTYIQTRARADVHTYIHLYIYSSRNRNGPKK